jgi:hypothetical protein
MKKYVMQMSIVAVAFMLLLASCKKNDTGTIAPADPAKDIEEVKLALKTNLSFINSFTTGIAGRDKARPNGRDVLPNTPTGVCPAFTLSFDTTGGWGIALGYDYGNGCPNDIALGIIRKGKVTYKYFLSGNLTNTISAKYENYQDSATRYNGLLKSAYQFTSLGHNYFLGADSLRLTNAAWGSSIYQTALSYNQQQGIGTPLVATDDVYHITGTTTTVNSALGLSRFEVLTPLVNKLDCVWIVAGRVKITLGTTVGIVDFGSGTCDNKGTLEVNGQIFPITF